MAQRWYFVLSRQELLGFCWSCLCQHFQMYRRRKQDRSRIYRTRMRSLWLLLGQTWWCPQKIQNSSNGFCGVCDDVYDSHIHLKHLKRSLKRENLNECRGGNKYRCSQLKSAVENCRKQVETSISFKEIYLLHNYHCKPKFQLSNSSALKHPPM